MNPVRYTLNGTATGSTVLMDYLANPFCVGIGCVATGTVTYSVQHTFDTLSAIVAGTATYFNNANITAASSSQSTNYAFPVMGIRLNITAAAVNGSVAITIIQATKPT